MKIIHFIKKAKFPPYENYPLHKKAKFPPYKNFRYKNSQKSQKKTITYRNVLGIKIV